MTNPAPLTQTAPTAHQEMGEPLDFVFRLEQPDGAGTLTQGAGHAHQFNLDADTEMEFQFGKASQRVEVMETAESDDLNTQGPVWYHWSVYIAPQTTNPTADSGAGKLHLGQFHQRLGPDGISDAPALMFNLTANGDLVAQFEAAVGKRAHLLVDGGFDGQGAKGQWIDIVVGADWRMAGGWTEFHVRQEGHAGFELMAFDSGPNTSTGSVYFKYGLYRSFLDRDPALSDSPAEVKFRDVYRSDRAEDVFTAPDRDILFDVSAYDPWPSGAKPTLDQRASVWSATTDWDVPTVEWGAQLGMFDLG